MEEFSKLSNKEKDDCFSYIDREDIIDTSGGVIYHIPNWIEEIYEPGAFLITTVMELCGLTFDTVLTLIDSKDETLLYIC